MEMIRIQTKQIKRKDENEIRRFVNYLNDLGESKKICKVHFVDELKGHDDELNEFQVTGYYNRGKMWVTYKSRRLKKILLTIAHEYKHFLQEKEPKHSLVDKNDDKGRLDLPKLCKVVNDVFVKSEFQADMWAGKVVKQFLIK